MQVIEVGRRTTCYGEMIAKYMTGKRFIQLIGTFEDMATLDDLLFSSLTRR